MNDISFLKIWKDEAHDIYSLPDEEAGKLYKALYEYMFTGTIPTFKNPETAIIWKYSISRMLNKQRRNIDRKYKDSGDPEQLQPEPAKSTGEHAHDPDPARQEPPESNNGNELMKHVLKAMKDTQEQKEQYEDFRKHYGDTAPTIDPSKVAGMNTREPE